MRPAQRPEEGLPEYRRTRYRAVETCLCPLVVDARTIARETLFACDLVHCGRPPKIVSNFEKSPRARGEGSGKSAKTEAAAAAYLSCEFTVRRPIDGRAPLSPGRERNA